jgi:hypothetical protein
MTRQRYVLLSLCHRIGGTARVRLNRVDASRLDGTWP